MLNLQTIIEAQPKSFRRFEEIKAEIKARKSVIDVLFHEFEKNEKKITNKEHQNEHQK